jgi:UDP-N-acetylglucosamine 2-epimerase (hydrolysing)
MKKILFVTGTRADYGKLKPLAQSAKKLGHHVSFWITGMHVLEEYGLTKLEIYNDDYDSCDEYINQKSGDTQSTVIAKTIMTFTDYLTEKRPDLIVIHGDRLEALACSIVAATSYVKILHVEGGEVSGTIDEVFRHAISKFSNVHCVSSAEAKSRLIKMGENPSIIYNIGSPELDLHLECDPSKLPQVKDHYDIKFDEYGIVIFHPVTSEVDTMFEQSQQLFKTLLETQKYFVVIKPNNDPGSAKINQIIESLPSSYFHVLPSMRFEYFSILLQNSFALIGNSSAGVREAPFLGVPSLNVGTRQTNRSTCSSITNISAYDRHAIFDFFVNQWGKRHIRDFSFGGGESIHEFSKILQTRSLFEGPTQKVFYDG